MTTSPDCNDDRDYEEYLHQKSKDQNAMLIDVVHKLSSALVYPECSNSETNEKLWNLYAQQWKPDAPWVIKMGQDKTQSPGTAYQCVGEEWSEKKDLQYIIETFIDPYVNSSSSHVGEIGSGGGRVAHQVYPRVKSLMCFDISQSMLDQARSYLDKAPNVTFHHLTTGSGFPSEVYGTFDFIYSFDVFVHLDLHTIWQYFQELYKLLKVNGQAFISTANVMSPLGWARFSKQQKYSVGGFYCTLVVVIL